MNFFCYFFSIHAAIPDVRSKIRQDILSQNNRIIIIIIITQGLTTLPLGVGSDNSRSIGIGIGVGVGGFLVILLAVILVVVILLLIRRSRSSKRYIVNHGESSKRKWPLIEGVNPMGERSSWLPCSPYSLVLCTSLL